MLRSLAISAIGATLFAINVSATEPNQPQPEMQQNGSVIVRIDTRTQEKQIVHVDAVVTDAQQARDLALQSTFAPIPADQDRGELDNATGASSWYYYYYYNYGYYPYYNYNPYYYYNYGYYNYYYYPYYYYPCCR